MAKTTFLQIPVAVNSGIASTYSERDDKTCRWDPSHYFDWRVSTLADRAGDMTIALGSAISESTLNGIKTLKSALTANGGVTSEKVFPENAAKGYAYAFAFKRDNATQATFLISGPHLRLQAQTDNKLYYYKTGASTQQGGVSLSSGIDLVIVNYDPVTDIETVYVNDATMAVASASSITYQNTVLTLAATAANNVNYGEILIFDSVKSAAEIAAIKAYYRAQYGN
ncbi:TPA: hypothetical protein NPW29_005188 [Klebsiella pneumoniae]|jgi:copper chaperone CopZ|uniref:hypothetical protein n=1 Tax=Klebsiella pneumoniae TaxID=573 RepID=UPI00058B9850|nr:hypothetical protein [Klebsiella pneumoniae]SBH08391.1 Uncharacterised protein [Klebsiella pneumoniae]SXJ59601.1 Uncharacterised protein [Klebsiella pneumoniae]SXP63091.1 Uncharacterised protein [Klebsiella pneumoniae]HCI7529214.1 hypothetical protein [Klebsiella pneumoniae]HDV0506650.1 hypothetical protein [Klebsiella pneumoniae]